MSNLPGFLVRIGARLGLSTDRPVLLRGEIAMDTDVQTPVFGNDTANPVRIPGEGSTGQFDLSTVDKLTLPGGVVLDKTKPGQVNGVDLRSINGVSGFLVRLADNKFTGRKLKSSDGTIAVTNADGKLGDADLQVNFGSEAFAAAIANQGFGITYGVAPPPNAKSGQGFFDTAEDILYLRLGTPETGAWVEV